MEVALIQPIQYAVKYAQNHKVWVVVLVPPKNLVSVRGILIGIVAGKCQGRTALLSGGGKISVITPDTSIDIPEGYYSIRVGWGVSTPVEDTAIKKWEASAIKILSAFKNDFDTRSSD